MNPILSAVLVLGVMGAVFGLVLAIASRIFAVETDPRLEPLTQALPGANCGGCGFSGCAAYAQAVLEGRAKVGLCASGGDAATQAMAEIMGVQAEKTERRVAVVLCRGAELQPKGRYDGIADCVAASKVGGRGPSACDYGCLGFGSCVQACKFDAMHLENGHAKVDPERCTGCMACAAACPRKVIASVPYGYDVVVACNSKAKGAAVIKACSVGCIGCGKCEKACQSDAIHVKDNLAAIDYSKCVACGLCIDACPRHLITDARLR